MSAAMYFGWLTGKYSLSRSRVLGEFVGCQRPVVAASIKFVIETDGSGVTGCSDGDLLAVFGSFLAACHASSVTWQWSSRQSDGGSIRNGAVRS